MPENYAKSWREGGDSRISSATSVAPEVHEIDLRVERYAVCHGGRVHVAVHQQLPRLVSHVTEREHQIEWQLILKSSE